MKNKNISFLIIGILSLVSVFALQDCYSGENCVISDYLYNNSYFPISTSACKLTVFNSDYTKLINNAQMTANSEGWHNYTIVFYNGGTYAAFMNCTADNEVILIDKTFRITNISVSVNLSAIPNLGNSLLQIENTNDLTIKISEVLNMLGFIFLWCFLWYFGYQAMQSKNDLLGGTMIILTLPIDIYFAYAWREVLMLGTGFIGIAFGFMFFWTIGVFCL